MPGTLAPPADELVLQRRSRPTAGRGHRHGRAVGEGDGGRVRAIGVGAGLAGGAVIGRGQELERTLTAGARAVGAVHMMMVVMMAGLALRLLQSPTSRRRCPANRRRRAARTATARGAAADACCRPATLVASAESNCGDVLPDRRQCDRRATVPAEDVPPRPAGQARQQPGQRIGLRRRACRSADCSCCHSA